jgi:caa(3)-type oxidase subunit IV
MTSSARRTVIPVFSVFVVLLVLTVAEIAVVKAAGVPRRQLIIALVLMALAKASLVLIFFMHLGRESRGLKLTVITPFALPAGYALTLIAEAAWRLGR